MKRYPECRRDYYDDTLLYCLDDGNALLEGPARSEPGAGGVPAGASPSGVQVATGFPADEPQTAIIPSATAHGEAPTREQIQMTDRAAILPANTVDVPDKPRGFDKRLLIAPLALAVMVLGGFFGCKYLSPAKQINSIAVMPLTPAISARR
jgi:hypothetical protein